MIISSPHDYREAARRRLPPFLFHYIDGGAGEEITLKRNREDLQSVDLPQRVLCASEATTATEFFGEPAAMPVILAPVGLTGMYARRGEAQAARAADTKGVPMTLSTVSVCSIEETQAASRRPLWFQLYVLKDRGFMRSVLDRAAALGVRVLVFTADMPVPGARYRDARSGMSGPGAAYKRVLQAMCHPHWAVNVGLRGRPHDLGNISAFLGRRISLEDYVGWLGANFDPSVTWRDLEWIRDYWQGPLVIKGVLTPEDALDAERFGAQGVVVSNHGGRQQDGAPSSARALPGVAEAVADRLTVLADSGVRSGADVARMIRLGAHGVMIGRAFAYALAAEGERGVAYLLDLFAKELRAALILAGRTSPEDLRRRG